MKVRYRKKFLKELSLIPAAQRTKIEQFVFKSLPAADSFHQLGVIEQMKGYPLCFKVRFGKYRIGLRMEDDAVWVPGLPGCWSQGSTEEEALENVSEAIQDYLYTVNLLTAENDEIRYVEISNA